MKSRKCLGILLCMMFLSGCTSYYLVKPIAPSVGNPKSEPKKVSSLQPTLTWKPTQDQAESYDLVIYEGIKEKSFWEGSKRSVGDQIYYREGIMGNSHTVQDVLKPETEYYWSVRIRNGSVTSDWASYDYTVFLVLSYTKMSHALFRFKTPTAQ